MDREPISSQPEVNIIQSDREGLAQRERERRLEDANHLIGVVHIETIKIKDKDEMLAVMSRLGIKNIDEILDNGLIKMSDLGAEQIIKPTFPNIDKILGNIKLLEESCGNFGYDQDGQADRLRDLVSRIRLSRDEQEIKNLSEQAKEIFFNNVSGLVRDRHGIAEQQDKLGIVCKSNGKQLQDNLESRYRFSEEERKIIEKGPIGFFVKKSVKYGKDETSLVEESLEFDYRYRKNITQARDEFSQVMDTLVSKNNQPK